MRSLALSCEVRLLSVCLDCTYGVLWRKQGWSVDVEVLRIRGERESMVWHLDEHVMNGDGDV